MIYNVTHMRAPVVEATATIAAGLNAQAYLEVKDNNVYLHIQGGN